MEGRKQPDVMLSSDFVFPATAQLSGLGWSESSPQSPRAMQLRQENLSPPFQPGRSQQEHGSSIGWPERSPPSSPLPWTNFERPSMKVPDVYTVFSHLDDATMHETRNAERKKDNIAPGGETNIQSADELERLIFSTLGKAGLINPGTSQQTPSALPTPRGEKIPSPVPVTLKSVSPRAGRKIDSIAPSIAVAAPVMSPQRPTAAMQTLATLDSVMEEYKKFAASEGHHNVKSSRLTRYGKVDARQ
eukprot:1892323-Rhodomonas_salina.1